MKAKILTVLLLGSALCSHPAISADVVGDNLNIGSQNTIYFGYGSILGAIGEYNWMSGQDLLAVGYDNETFDSYCGLLVGYGNVGSGFGYSAIIGRFNLVSSSTNSLVAGENNYLTNGYGAHTSLLGTGLLYNSYSSTDPKIIVGKYNKEISDPLFVVANGTSATTEDRKNAFEVLQDGTVRIPKPQGDILMGEFGE